MSRIQKLETIYKEPLKEKNIKDTSIFIQSVLNTDVTKGKYARFLIESFLNDKFLEEDLIGGVDSTVGKSISLFDKHKSKLPVHERSVYALNPETKLPLYQSPGDLWNSVKQYQGELSGKELKKEEQEKIYRETEFIYKDENTEFQIVSPLTEESAKWWGKGTRWCTSAEKNNAFWDYAKGSPLFVIMISNHKLQLWQFDNEIQFMDEADNHVSLEYIKQHWSLLEPICKWLNDLQYIPKEYITKELCELAVQKNGLFLNCVPMKLRTQELCKLAVKENGAALGYTPEELKTSELCEIAVQNNGSALRYVPKHLITQELCELAIKENGEALYYVPKEYETKELYELAVKQNGDVLSDVPDELITLELYELAVKQDGRALMHIPKELRTPNLCQLAVQQSRWALQYVPDKYKTPELYKLAVRQDGYAIQYIFNDFLTKELCELAVKQNGNVLGYVPEHLRTLEICELAVKQNARALCYVPGKFKDQFKDQLQHYVTDEVFELPMEKYQETFQKIKTFFPKKDISLSCHS